MNFYSSSAPSINLMAISGANVFSDFYVDWQIQPQNGEKDINETLARIGKIEYNYRNFYA
jgi:hypothetical protein